MPATALPNRVNMVSNVGMIGCNLFLGGRIRGSPRHTNSNNIKPVMMDSKHETEDWLDRKERV